MGASNSLKQLLLTEASAGVPRAVSPEVVADPKQNREYLHVRVHHVIPTILHGKILAVPTTFFFPVWLLCVCFQSPEHRESSQDFERDSVSIGKRIYKFW